MILEDAPAVPLWNAMDIYAHRADLIWTAPPDEKVQLKQASYQREIALASCYLTAPVLFARRRRLGAQLLIRSIAMQQMCRPWPIPRILTAMGEENIPLAVEQEVAAGLVNILFAVIAARQPFEVEIPLQSRR